ncbi:vegetative cell wall protein gp1-like [Miscanthus floridulus]|uniref:vegetative cell wall protein gp1-like n=1 Tax=Miscanthus floridulus TaxID=154761 RepID=UPI00345AD0D8
MAIFLPAAQHRSQQPSSPPPFPAWPSSRQPPNRAGPAAPAQPRAPCRPSLAAPGNCRAQQLTPGSHLSAPSPTPRGSATARSWRCSNRLPRRASWARPPVALGLVKRQPSPPPRAPPAAPAPFSPRPGRNCRTEEPRRPPTSPSASPSSPSRLHLRFSPVVSSPWPPLSPHAFQFEFRGF